MIFWLYLCRKSCTCFGETAEPLAGGTGRRLGVSPGPAGGVSRPVCGSGGAAFRGGALGAFHALSAAPAGCAFRGAVCWVFWGPFLGPLAEPANL